jgi:hypothetical protein
MHTSPLRFRIWLGLLGVLLCLNAQGEPADATQAAAALEKARREALAITVTCARLESPGDTAASGCGIKAPDLRKADQAADEWLSAPGYVKVEVDAASYLRAKDAAAKEGGKLRLVLNGFDMGTSAGVVGEVPGGDRILLTFRVGRSADNKDFWLAVFHEQGLTGGEPLQVGVGWSKRGITGVAPSASQSQSVRVSSPQQLALSGFGLALLLLLSIAVAWGTDIVRDGATPTYWKSARQLRRRLSGVRQRMLAGDPFREELREALQTTAWRGRYSDDQLDTGAYDAAAERALKGRPDPTDVEGWVVIGLALRTKAWRAQRASFSLGRVQLGLWFLFVVAVSVFLRVALGELPTIPPTLLALITVSAGTAGMSALTDVLAAPRLYRPSQGIVLDLLTGFDEKLQLHRFQAMVVNGLLLVTGFADVCSTLAFPEPDPTWLGFLGVSGITLAAGKQLREGGDAAAPADAQPKPSAPRHTPPTLPSPPPSPALPSADVPRGPVV